ncbi:MAG: IS4 family transposase [Methylococcaceae bacterium]|nr:IS4 family transposase [Methylococcaceae bacterium]
MNVTEKIRKNQQKQIRDQLRATDCYSFFNLLTGPELLEFVDTELPEHRERLYPPTVTLSLFLTQALISDRSCQQAVNGYVVSRTANGLEPCSTGTGAYCKARQNLPLQMIRQVARQSGRLIHTQTPSAWHWRGRRVKLVDGTTVTMPDTAENQQVFPQMSGQKAGLGFPIARIVGLICLGSGALLDAAIGPFTGKGSGEHALFRQLLDSLEPGDLVLADRYYCSYWLIAQLLARGVDVVFGQHCKRKTDFRKGRRLGARDHLIAWNKPKQCPDWMEKDQYEQLPETLQIRESEVAGKVLVTTLLSPKDTPKSELSNLYQQRWQIELDLRNLKTTLGMETLSCRTPLMNEKEIWVYLLAYNLIRLLMCEAALQADILPRQISFKHTVQIWIVWSRQSWGNPRHEPTALLFVWIAEQRVGDRPGRIEPRAVKRRPKPYPKLMTPRAQARANIRKYGHPKKLK